MSNDGNGTASGADQKCDVLVVGAGFAGLYAVYTARRLGYSVICIERGGGVGGTWYWNRYPGARCDIQSIDYSYSFDKELQRDWRWSERYPTQPEILRYAEHVTDRFKLRQYIRFNERVETAAFDEDASAWSVKTDLGGTIEARWMIMAVGSLSEPIRPNIPGLETFAGETIYTADWPQDEVSFANKRVGVIGTGSSGIQLIPNIVEQAKSLTVFQRSPNYSVPIFNRDISEEEWREVQETYPERRRKSFMSGGGSLHEAHPEEVWNVPEDQRRELFEAAWKNGGVLFAKVFPNQTTDDAVNALAREFAESKIREMVKDQTIAEQLIPTDHAIGAKRICTDDGYFDVFNRDNVQLVNLQRDPIEAITGTGIRTSELNIDLDMLIIATGFDAMTGALTRIDIRGPRGDTIAQTWSDGPLTLLGVSIPGFPNLFNITGPGSPSVLANMVLAAEHQVDWVFGMIRDAEQDGHTMSEARGDAAQAWTQHVGEVAERTLFTRGNTWYLGANVEGKKRVFMPYIGGLGAYIRYCDKVRENGYKGFVFSA